jgi:general secretion pathway protein D
MEQEMETRYYHLSSGIGAFTEFKKSVQQGGGIETESGDEGAIAYDLAAADEGGMETTTEETTIKDVLEESGVPFPGGSSVYLDRRTSTLIVRNTPDNLNLIEEILDRIDVPPFQVEIEAKFVAISASSLEEMGFEWILESPLRLGDSMQVDPLNADEQFGKYPYMDSARGDGYEVGDTDDDGIADTAYPYNRGLSKGVRFIEGSEQPGFSTGTLGGSDIPYYLSQTGTDMAVGNILSISGILTDPEFQVIVHALDQSGNANELSAPKVTTVNNQQAQIEAVTELRYPGSYEVTPPVVGTGNTFTPAIVTPTDFITRDVGIILNVTPSVGSDRHTINLTLIPEVSELIGWIDYGFTFLGDAVPIIQPIFKTRNVTTSVIIHDGETIVLGGLMNEEVMKMKDKIPLLGDVPILGRLFRNDAERTNKTNLLIFVTAKLLDPSGNLIKDVE